MDLVSGPDLAAPSPAARERIDGHPYRVTFWRPLSVTTETAELSEEEAAALRALGYLGEE